MINLYYCSKLLLEYKCHWQEHSQIGIKHIMALRHGLSNLLFLYSKCDLSTHQGVGMQYNY
jgi:hypothetical protein